MSDNQNRPPKGWREARRLRAWSLKQEGWSQKAIAEALGASQGAVSKWMRRAEEGGAEALRSQPRRGAPRRLKAEQQERLAELLDQGAGHFGFRGEVWTRGRVAHVITREFGVRYSARHVGRLLTPVPGLKAIRWSSQKPVERASQRHEAAIEQWREETWPRLQKKPRRKDAR
jgi:transposase